MSTEQNKTIVRQLIEEVWNKGNLSRAEALISASFVDHTAPPGLAPGLEGFKQMYSMFRAAFPDLQISIEDQIAEGDKVVGRVTLHGTHQGDFRGMSPTGKAITVTGIRIDRITKGKVVEHWASFDQLGMLQQLGAVPTPG